MPKARLDVVICLGWGHWHAGPSPWAPTCDVYNHRRSRNYPARAKGVKRGMSVPLGLP